MKAKSKQVQHAHGGVSQRLKMDRSHTKQIKANRETNQKQSGAPEDG